MPPIEKGERLMELWDSLEKLFEHGVIYIVVEKWFCQDIDI